MQPPTRRLLGTKSAGAFSTYWKANLRGHARIREICEWERYGRPVIRSASRFGGRDAADGTDGRAAGPATIVETLMAVVLSLALGGRVKFLPGGMNHGQERRQYRICRVTGRTW